MRTGLMIVAVCGIALVGGCARQPQSESAITFPLKRTPERLARGRYLLTAVVLCFDCHSEADWKSGGSMPLPGRKGGGQRFPDTIIPFSIYCPNISPDAETGAGKWSDEDFYRALTRGIGHDGRTLLPLMPYRRFRHMSEEDLASVIVYVRSIDPVRNVLPKNEFPEQVKSSLLPLPPKPHEPPPDLSTPERRGAYLVNIADCAGCHTPDQNGVTVPGLDLAGGMELKGPWGDVASANLTPDPSGIPHYDEATFIQTIRTGKIGARKLNSVMPWHYFRQMTDQDLKSVWAYLRTLKPVQHRTDNTEPFKPCKRCGNRHGLGDMN